MARTNTDRAALRIKSAYAWARKKADAVEAAIHNETISEEAFDALLEAEDRALDALADAITEGTGGAVTPGEADMLARLHLERVGELVARLAV